jgi:hypothetical protein
MMKWKGSTAASTRASKRRKAKLGEEEVLAYYCQVLKPTIPDDEGVNYLDKKQQIGLLFTPK